MEKRLYHGEQFTRCSIPDTCPTTTASPRRPTVRRVLGPGWHRTANTKLQPENYWRITKSLHGLYRNAPQRSTGNLWRAGGASTTVSGNMQTVSNPETNSGAFIAHRAGRG